MPLSSMSTETYFIFILSFFPGVRWVRDEERKVFILVKSTKELVVRRRNVIKKLSENHLGRVSFISATDMRFALDLFI